MLQQSPNKDIDELTHILENIHDRNINPLTRELYLMSSNEYIGVLDGEEAGVEFSMANEFIRNLTFLESMSTSPITIHMATCGGDWYAGMQIYDTIKKSECEITIISYTHARSMSSLIFLAADYRKMLNNSLFMFHGGETHIGGTQRQLTTEYKQNEISTETMMNIYVEHLKANGKHMKRSKKFIREWIEKQMMQKEDVFFSAQEALDIGFTDEII